ncbi:MAG TPA: winged helix-turn-helix domain-containing protein [Micromonosporaceae bacterium]
MPDADPYGGSAALASWAALLADRTRAAIVLALLDGRAWTVTELARHSGVAVSTASEHVDLLVDGGLLAAQRQGRHRYLRLADGDVAATVESVAAAAGHRPAPVRTLSAHSRRRALAQARTCYDHLAGVLGVAITDAMTRRGLLAWDRGLTVTATGCSWLAELGIDTAPAGRRPFVRSCVDWTQRRPHLAGTVGAALCRHAFDAGWIRRIGSTRAVAVTDCGRDALAHHLGLDGRLLHGGAT